MMRLLWAGLALLAGGCAASPPPATDMAVVAANSCRSASVTIAYDFDGAPPLRCWVTGERAFSLLVTPEHAPPINPSPWYAFRYTAQGDGPVSVTLRYLEGGHRYAPKFATDGSWREIPAEVSADGKAARIDLPPGAGVIAAQELMEPVLARQALSRWAEQGGTKVFTLGTSHDGRSIDAVRLGRPDAPRLVVLLGRQHPPEVTGAIAMEAFVGALAARAGDLGDVQVLVVPMLNPDGVVRGHWRANRGAVDLNRDWGAFTQPETRSVKAWLDRLPRGVRPVLMVDFHSTRTNLFYVQGDDEASAAQQRFRAAWLDGRENALPGYPFTIEPRNANPGSGTAKNWFHATYAIPAYTYEVADEAGREAARAAADMLAQRLLPALDALKD
ncbi:MAG: M14 family metallopeptidase [Erythrobacter sp.]